jgi:hypothetical protein
MIQKIKYKNKDLYYQNQNYGRNNYEDPQNYQEF